MQRLYGVHYCNADDISPILGCKCLSRPALAQFEQVLLDLPGFG